MFGSLLKAAASAVDDAVKHQQQQSHGTPHGIAGNAPRDSTYPEDPDVPLSDLTGRKKALFIGINYFGTQSELKGCINDVHSIKEFVMRRFNFPAENMLVLTDDNQDPRYKPTRANILQGFAWLIEGVTKGDSLFLHYSGHGGSIKDATSGGDEADGMDETICPLDYASAGQIVDDEIHARLVKVLPAGVRLTAIFDSCHSGSVMDLPYTYNIDGNLDIQEVDNRKIAIQAAMNAGVAFLRGDKTRAMTEGISAVQHFLAPSGGSSTSSAEAHRRQVEARACLADVIQFSGCRDEQTSADTSFAGRAQGAMSYSFIDVCSRFPQQLSYTDLLKNLRQVMQGKFTQVPQISTGHKMNLRSNFNM